MGDADGGRDVYCIYVHVPRTALLELWVGKAAEREAAGAADGTGVAVGCLAGFGFGGAIEYGEDLAFAGLAGEVESGFAFALVESAGLGTGARREQKLHACHVAVEDGPPERRVERRGRFSRSS